MFRVNDKTAISRDCVAELRQHNRLNRYTSWDEKSEGKAPGVILKGLDKNGFFKRTFVKKIYIEKNFTSDFDELLAMTAAKACGVLCPNLKLKTAGSAFYLFARDLSVYREDADNPKFSTMKAIGMGCSDYEFVNDTMIAPRELAYQPEKYITVDQYSIAKIAIASLVFDFRDLHDDNIGVVVHQAQGTAEFAVIDVSAAAPAMHRVDFSKFASLVDLIKQYPIVKNYFNELPIENLSEEDCKRALEEIAAHMAAACEAALSLQNQSGVGNIIASDHIANKIANWKRNLETLQLFAINPLFAAKLK